jgi:DNA-binding transcriptional MerR regulator
VAGAYPIKVAAKKSGLTVHAIRVWENRYSAITPERSSTRRRLYSDEEITRLKLLHDVTKAGYNIGSVARMPESELRALLQDSAPVPSTSSVSRSDGEDSALIKRCMDGVRKLDAAALEQELRSALVKLGFQALLVRVVAPLATEVGESWRGGEISSAQEHFVTAIIRNFIVGVQKQFSSVQGAPRLVVATPVGQLHELGAILCAASASNLGWYETYLGASLPASEVAGVAVSSNARAVALSIVFPANDPAVSSELSALSAHLPSSCKLILGGRAAESYDGIIGTIGAIRVADLDQFCRILDSLWSMVPSL